MTSPWRLLFWSGVFAFVGFGGWGAEPSSQFLTLDGFKAKPGVERGQLRFQGHGGYEVFLVNREELSRLDLRFGARSVSLFPTGVAFGYGEESWLANKPLEWRGEKVGGVFEPYALIFRAFRPRAEGGKPIETYVVVRLEGCDARVVGAFPAEEGPLEAVRHADKECRRIGSGRLTLSRRMVVERAVSEWLEAVRSGDEKRLRGAYAATFLRGGGKRTGKEDEIRKRVAETARAEAVEFLIKGEGSRLDVSFSLFREFDGGSELAPFRVRLGMVMEGQSAKITSEALEAGDLSKSGNNRGAVQGEGAAGDGSFGGGLSEMMLGRWLASDGKGMMTLVFEEGGRFTRRRLGGAGKGDSGSVGAWSVRGDLVLVDFGRGEEERRLTPAKGGRFKLEGAGGVLFLEKQR